MGSAIEECSTKEVPYLRLFPFAVRSLCSLPFAVRRTPNGRREAFGNTDAGDDHGDGDAVIGSGMSSRA